MIEQTGSDPFGPLLERQSTLMSDSLSGYDIRPGNRSMWLSLRLVRRLLTIPRMNTKNCAETRALDGDQRSKYGVGMWTSYRGKIQF